MSKKYIVVVSDTVPVPIVATIKDADGNPVTHKFSLTCKRLEANDIQSRLESGLDTRTIMQDVTKGWSGQRLVNDPDTNTAADFNPDALDALLNIPGMANVCFGAYGKESSAHTKT